MTVFRYLAFIREEMAEKSVLTLSDKITKADTIHVMRQGLTTTFIKTYIMTLLRGCKNSTEKTPHATLQPNSSWNRCLLYIYSHKLQIVAQNRILFVVVFFFCFVFVCLKHKP